MMMFDWSTRAQARGVRLVGVVLRSPPRAIVCSGNEERLLAVGDSTPWGTVQAISPGAVLFATARDIWVVTMNGIMLG